MIIITLVRRVGSQLITWREGGRKRERTAGVREGGNGGERGREKEMEGWREGGRNER